MENQLSIQNVSKRFQTGDGVFNFSLDVKKGELISLLGPSGCGKTTILRTVGGFVQPDSGEILINGKSVMALPPDKRPTAMVFQSYNLWPHMTVYQNLAFGLKIRRKPIHEITELVENVLRLVRLPGVEKKYPSQLSGGQQQRVALARALLLEPAVLLLDEPFSALDARLRYEMREELREIQSTTGTTMVFVTHDQEEALSISDRVVVMNAGNIEQIDSPANIYDAPSSLFVAKFIGRMNFLDSSDVIEKMNLEKLVAPQGDLNGGVTIASRPEDVVLLEANQDGLSGTIRHVMVLGHYVEATVVTDCGLIRVFLPRDAAKEYKVGDAVRVGFSRVQLFQTA